MEIETELEVKFRTTIGDFFDERIDKKTAKELVEEHIRDFCIAHDIERKDVRIIKEEKE